MSHARAFNPARICLGLDPGAGESCPCSSAAWRIWFSRLRRIAARTPIFRHLINVSLLESGLTFVSIIKPDSRRDTANRRRSFSTTPASFRSSPKMCAFGWLAHSRNARLRHFTEDTRLSVTVSEIARRISLPSHLRLQIAEIRHNHVEDRLTRNLLLALLISLLDRLPGDALNLHAINLSISKLHFQKCREERGSVRYATLRDAIAI